MLFPPKLEGEREELSIRLEDWRESERRGVVPLPIDMPGDVALLLLWRLRVCRECCFRMVGVVAGVRCLLPTPGVLCLLCWSKELMLACRDRLLEVLGEYGSGERRFGEEGDDESWRWMFWSELASCCSIDA